VVKIIRTRHRAPSHQPLDQAAAEVRGLEEYREAFGSHAYDDGRQLHRRPGVRRVHARDEAQAAWAEYAVEVAPRLDGDEDQSPRSRSSIPSTRGDADAETPDAE